MKFCTYLDSTAVSVCTNFHCDQTQIQDNTSKKYFHKISNISNSIEVLLVGRVSDGSLLMNIPSVWVLEANKDDELRNKQADFRGLCGRIVYFWNLKATCRTCLPIIYYRELWNNYFSLWNHMNSPERSVHSINFTLLNKINSRNGGSLFLLQWPISFYGASHAIWF